MRFNPWKRVVPSVDCERRVPYASEHAGIKQGVSSQLPALTGTDLGVAKGEVGIRVLG